MTEKGEFSLLLRFVLLLLVQLTGTTQQALAQPLRSYAPRSWVLVWKDGGRVSDSTFGWIREHTATSQAIYVLDAGTLQVHAYHPVERRLLWSAGRKGSGPGEFLAPVDIASTSSGAVVLDPANGRVSEYGLHGNHIRDYAHPLYSRAKALCVMSDGSLVLHTTQRDAFLVRMSRAGRILRKWPFPWNVSDPDNPMLTNAVTLRGLPDHSCHFATTFGFGLIHVDTSNRLRTTKLVEQYPTPTFITRRGSNGLPGLYLEKGTNASLGGSHWRDTLGVIAMSAQGKLVGLDLYEKSSGRYLSSWLLPPDDRFAVSGRLLVGLSSSGITQSIRVWADSSDTLAVLRAMGIRKRPTTRPDSAKKSGRTRTTIPTPPAGTPARPPAPARVPPQANR